MRMMTGKRGQVTLFIILAIIIASVILAFVFWVKPSYVTDTSKGPKLDRCIQDAVEQGIADLGKTAGYLRPEFTYPHQGEEFVYLCYTNEYHKTCTVQQPFIKQHFEQQLQLHLRDQITSCYQNALQELRDQGYGVTSGAITYEVDFEPGLVVVGINAPTIIGSQSFKKINVQFSSSLYEMMMIATSILQSETHYGDADSTEIMFYYPDYIIDKLKQDDGTTLYIIQHKLSEEKLQFASRSLVFPPGYSQ